MNCYFTAVNYQLLDRLMSDDDPVFVRRLPPNQSLPELDEENMRQINETKKKLTEYVKNHLGPVASTIPTISAIPIMVLETPPDDILPPINLELRLHQQDIMVHASGCVTRSKQ